MITAFMDDAANIMSFYGEVDVADSVGYSVELWVFKPQKSGKQVFELLKKLLELIRYSFSLQWLSSKSETLSSILTRTYSVIFLS